MRGSRQSVRMERERENKLKGVCARSRVHGVYEGWGVRTKQV
jgi:hypothetical protein